MTLGTVVLMGEVTEELTDSLRIESVSLCWTTEPDDEDPGGTSLHRVRTPGEKYDPTDLRVGHAADRAAARRCGGRAGAPTDLRRATSTAY